ncbi:hypothetical protein ACKFKG_17585 [Phormidesmis sp. 146-35]
MTQPWSSPINLFKRLYVKDGLPIDADRWNVAHDYHRRRQDAHHQAFNQSGIISGLGVRIISAPKDVEEQYKSSPWVEIQPGMAIDTFGNFMVLAKPEVFRIAGQTNRETLTEYLVISYVNPDEFIAQEHPKSSLDGVVIEQARIYEKDQPPIDGEVELCRMRFKPENGVLRLSHPLNVFAPGDNTLDFSYRVQARSRPQAVVQVAQAFYDQSKREQRDQDEARLSSLLRSVEALYPAIAAKQISQINLSREPENIVSLKPVNNPGAQVLELLNKLITQQETVDPKTRSNMLQLMEQLSEVIQGRSDLSTQNNIRQLISRLSDKTANSLEAALDQKLSVQLSELLKELLKYDLIYFRMTATESLIESVQDELKQYLLTGGVLLVEASLKETEIGQKIEELINLQQELQVAIAQSETTIDSLISTKNTAKIQEYQTIQNQLQESLNAVQSKLKRAIDEFCYDFKDLAETQLNQPLEDLENLIQQPDHPLRSQPFLFSALPVIEGQPIKILVGGGIVFVLGNLSSAWGVDPRSLLPRETIRTAQEMGINILYFAHRRKQMTQLLNPTAG